jgi:hypothetical protein
MDQFTYGFVENVKAYLLLKILLKNTNRAILYELPVIKQVDKNEREVNIWIG